MKKLTELEMIEKRFKEVTGLNELNMSMFPIKKDDFTNQHQKTDKDKQKMNGFIATPIHLVDQMVNENADKSLAEGASKIKKGKDWSSCDYCAGCGQFTVRILRCMKNKYNIDPTEVNYLQKHHTLVELDPDNCAELIYIFGPKINLFAGDALKLNKALDEDTGVLFFNKETDSWEHNFFLDRILKFEEVYGDRKLLKQLFNDLNNKKLMARIFKRLHKKHSR